MNRIKSIPGKFCLSLLCLLTVTACTTDESQPASDPTHEENPSGEEIEITPVTLTRDGTYEGEWLMTFYGIIDTGQLMVEGDMLSFDLPAEAVLPRLGLVDEKTRKLYADEPFYTTTSDYQYGDVRQDVTLVMQGYSKSADYYGMIGVENAFGSSFAFGVTADEVPYVVELIGIKEEFASLFDHTGGGLWSLSIPIDNIVVTNQLTGRVITIKAQRESSDDTPAWRLVFHSKSKIK